MKWYRFVILWMVYLILFSAAVWGLEVLEGNKITTSEYYGLRNLKFVFIVLPTLIMAVAHPLLILPLSLVLRKFVPVPPVLAIIYIGLGGLGGYLLFHELYDSRFVQEYQLNVSSAVVIFALLGLVYSLLDHDLARRYAVQV